MPAEFLGTWCSSPAAESTNQPEEPPGRKEQSPRPSISEELGPDPIRSFPGRCRVLVAGTLGSDHFRVRENDAPTAYAFPCRCSPASDKR
jgi:hypothetical protein